MDEFELAGFDEYECEQLRKIVEGTGIDPARLICVIRNSTTNTELICDQEPHERFCEAWDYFKQAMWEEFADSRFGRFMIRLADKLVAWLERF